MPRYAAFTAGSSRIAAGVPFGDRPSEVQHQDAVADGHHHLHVVLDQQDGHALVPDAPDQADQLLALALVHAGGRLVQEEEPRAGGQGAGDLEPPLVPVGQVPRELVGDVLQPDEPEQRVRLAPDRAGLGPGARRRAQVREAAAPEARVEAHLHGLPGPHPGERPDVLEGPGDARAGPPVGRQPRRGPGRRGGDGPGRRGRRP